MAKYSKEVLHLTKRSAERTAKAYRRAGTKVRVVKVVRYKVKGVR